MVNKICFLKNYYGGDCLHTSHARAETQYGSNKSKGDDPWKYVLPDAVETDVPIAVYQRRLPEGEPRLDRKASAKEIILFQEAEPTKSIGEQSGYRVIDETLSKDGTTKIVNQSKYNEIAHEYNKVKGVPTKVNAALVALDAANFYYEHQDEIHTVEDFVNAYGEDIVEGATTAAGIVGEAIMQGDIPTLAATSISLVGVPVVTRTIDNVADIVGIEGVNTTGAVMDATYSASSAAAEVVKDSQNGNPFVVPTIGGIISGIIKRWL